MRKRRMKVIAVVLSLLISGLAVACAKPPPAPATTPVPMPTPVPMNSESASTTRELEAKIRQLETENQRLLTENRQLNSDLETIANQLDVIQSLVSSSSYANMLSQLTEIQHDTSDLGAFVHGLPDLPPLPPGLTPGKIEEMIGMAQELYWIIYHLPPLPPFPPELAELERQRQTFLEVFEFVGDLNDLPNFLSSAESLEDLRFQYETYLSDVQNTTSNAGSLMQQVRDTASGY